MSFTIDETRLIVLIESVGLFVLPLYIPPWFSRVINSGFLNLSDIEVR